MGEANRRAIAQGFDDAEHRRLHLSVEEMRKENTRNSDAAARVRHYKVQDNIYGNASDLIEHQRDINEVYNERQEAKANVDGENVKPMSAIETHLMVSKQVNNTVAITKAEYVAEYETEPLTTKKICAGEYEVTRNRDGKVVRIDKARSGWWQLNDDGVVSRHDTLAAAKAAIPA